VIVAAGAVKEHVQRRVAGDDVVRDGVVARVEAAPPILADTSTSPAALCLAHETQMPFTSGADTCAQKPLG
jgi:hypothetical protein